MKTISRYIMTLALLITAVTGAWATEEYESFDLSSGNTKVNGTHFSITGTDGMNTYGLFLSAETVTVTSLNGENITRVEFIIGLGKNNAENITGTPGTNSCTNGNEKGSITDINATSVTLSTENTGSNSVSIKQITVYYGNSEPAETDVEVTTNAAEEGATFTEASFKMPQYDATAEYELVRDMSIQMTAKMGDGTEGVRYRVKKAQQGQGYEPADLSMTQVLALVAVNDGIEQKALTLDQDYTVLIYPVDENRQILSGAEDGIPFENFTYAPGLYALKAVAQNGSPYAGETALSNTFKLFQGYEVEVAAKEFITYYKDEALYVEDEDAELYTIQSVNGDQAVLSDKSDAMPSNTPMLVYNKSNETKVILLIPCAEPDMTLTVAPEFQGTLTATTIAASTDAQTNYALNGKQFVFVKNAIEVGPNKAWLSINTGVPSARITLVFEETTGLSEELRVKSEEFATATWYTLDGRKIAAPTKKGIYIMNGRKVVVK